MVKNYFGNIDNFMEKFSNFFKVWIEEFGYNIVNYPIPYPNPLILE